MSEVSATMRYSVVIPVGSRHSDLVELYDEYRQGLDALGRPYETIFVVDGPQPDAIATLRAYYQIEASGISSLVSALDNADMSIGRRWPRAGGQFETLRRSAFHGI